MCLGTVAALINYTAGGSWIGVESGSAVSVGLGNRPSSIRKRPRDGPSGCIWPLMSFLVAAPFSSAPFVFTGCLLLTLSLGGFSFFLILLFFLFGHTVQTFSGVRLSLP